MAVHVYANAICFSGFHTLKLPPYLPRAESIPVNIWRLHAGAVCLATPHRGATRGRANTTKGNTHIWKDWGRVCLAYPDHPTKPLSALVSRYGLYGHVSNVSNAQKPACDRYAVHATNASSVKSCTRATLRE